MLIYSFRIAALLLLFMASYAFALDVETHGFFTMGYSISNSNVAYLDTITNQGDYSAISDAGLQFSAQLDNRLNAKIQIISIGRNDASFTPTLDLAQIEYLISSDHEVLLGRLRLPLFLISEYRNIGTLYPWTVPPPEIYEILPVGTVGDNDTFTGVNFLNRLARQHSWTLDSEVFGGGSARKIVQQQNEIDSTIKRLFGATLSLNSPGAQIRVAYLNSLNQSTIQQNTGANGTRIPNDTSLGVIQFITLGGRWEPESWLLQAEGARIFSENARFQEVYSYYGTAGYRFLNRKILLHETVATAVDSSHPGSGLGQTSFTTGLNFSITDSAMVKLEWQRAFPKSQDTQAASPSGPPTPPGGPTLYASAPPDRVDVFHLSVSAAF